MTSPTPNPTRHPAPQILVTNDDGVDAPGLRALASALACVGAVTVVAPAEESSAVSHALTVRRPLELRTLEPGWYSVDGTPTDCVNVAVSEILQRVPDLVVSGINNGLNVGDDVTYSGTVAGALEGVLVGAPAIAVSLQRATEMDYGPAATLLTRLAATVLNRGLPPRTLLNVNLPRGAHRGVRVTVQGSRTQRFATEPAPGGGDSTAVWIGGAEFNWSPDPDSDYTAVKAGWVSVTPLHADWTHHAARAAIETLAAETVAEVE